MPLPAGPGAKPAFRKWEKLSDHWVLRYAGEKGHVLEFHFDPAGKQIRVRQSHPEWRNAIFVLVCAAFAAWFQVQGKPVLHAASLVRGRDAFLVMGRSSAGKSSLTAALVAEGLALHSDDIAVLTAERPHPVVQAGYPRLKITPGTAKALGWDAEHLQTIFFTEPEYGEKWLDLSKIHKGFYDAPAPLKGIYILSGRSPALDAPRIQSLQPGKAAAWIASHLYGHPWLQKPGRQAILFTANVARSVPVYRLQLPEGLDTLRSSAHHVLRHIDRTKRHGTRS